MACMWRVWRRGCVFAGRLRNPERPCDLAGVLFRSSSTKAVPHTTRMEYQDAICTLNTLQTNASSLEQVRQERSHPQLQLQAMVGFLERSGLTVDKLDHLNIIHVTGTKGKGSTCAFTERILRSYGFRTGFYSSPHLVQVRERICINGQPIGKELFAKYFWQVYGQLYETKEVNGGSMPAYFRFLTILAFHVFLQEKVDLAIIEVGIGGAYDCTNIIRRPWVCGISSLGIDHTQILGETIEKIAWQKGGIFKTGVPAFTVKQPEEAMVVLKDRAKEIGVSCSLQVCPSLVNYDTDCGPLVLGLAGQHQHPNASLALQLSHTWMQRRCLQDKRSFQNHGVVSAGCQANAFKLSPIMLKGLAETKWPGRNQTLKHGQITYFLDGAHTMRSMLACVQWFKETAAQHEHTASGPVARVLLFNSTGERDSAAMLKLLVPCQFDFAVFCPNITEAIASCNADQQNFNVSVENMLTRCLDNQNSWHLLNSNSKDLIGPQMLISDALHMVPEKKALVFPCILSSLQWIAQGKDSVLMDSGKTQLPVKPSVMAKAALLRETTGIHVLITGSLHLVGGALKHLDPAMSK